ncbi:MAG: hypothetical protein GY821_10780 [Gammaproteobacteria bacterium]|nr:hypothetical protein [Gammaproteobacteria bacterium]
MAGTARTKKERIEQINDLDQTVKIEKNQTEVNLTEKKYHTKIYTKKHSLQEDKIDAGGNMLSQKKETMIDSTINIPTTHIATNMQTKQTHKGDILKKIQNTRVKIKDNCLNLKANIEIKQKHSINKARNDDYIRTQNIKTA